jgi:hypothetical protein
MEPFRIGVCSTLKSGQDRSVVYSSMSVSCSGDGTVPYWSLQHAQEWAGPQCGVLVNEIDHEAYHRKIMDDDRFHAVVFDYSGTSQTKKVPRWNMSLVLTVYFSKD